MIVVVEDQAARVVKDAKVSVSNTATGATREAVSGSDGSATFAALSLTGNLPVSVSKAGFGNEDGQRLALRAGETATLKVKLPWRLRTRPESPSSVPPKECARTPRSAAAWTAADRRDADPRPQAPSLPLLNSAFRQAKGTGDLFVNRPTSSPARVPAAPPPPRSTAPTTTRHGAARP